MQPEYRTVVDVSAMVSSLVPMLIHLGALAAQCFLAGYLLVQGGAHLVNPAGGSAWLERLGALCPQEMSGRIFGSIEVAIGLLLLGPLVLRLPWILSGFACIAGLVLLILLGREAPETGRLVRRMSGLAAIATLALMAFEGDDPATQTARILTKTSEWRAHEIDWQLVNDRGSPKVGDLAPDFELDDPSGKKSVRLAAFRGQRPVALVFGSYT